MTISWRRMHLIFCQSRVRSPLAYVESARLAIIPSRPILQACAKNSRPPPSPRVLRTTPPACASRRPRIFLRSTSVTARVDAVGYMTSNAKNARPSTSPRRARSAVSGSSTCLSRRAPPPRRRSRHPRPATRRDRARPAESRGPVLALREKRRHFRARCARRAVAVVLDLVDPVLPTGGSLSRAVSMGATKSGSEVLRAPAGSEGAFERDGPVDGSCGFTAPARTFSATDRSERHTRSLAWAVSSGLRPLATLSALPRRWQRRPPSQVRRTLHEQPRALAFGAAFAATDNVLADKPAPSTCRRRARTRRPFFIPSRGSPGGVRVPRSRSITVPPPYWPSDDAPNPPYSDPRTSGPAMQRASWRYARLRLAAAARLTGCFARVLLSRALLQELGEVDHLRGRVGRRRPSTAW